MSDAVGESMQLGRPWCCCKMAAASAVGAGLAQAPVGPAEAKLRRCRPKGEWCLLVSERARRIRLSMVFSSNR